MFEIAILRIVSAVTATATIATATVVGESSLIPLGLVIIACGLTWRAATKFANLEARIKALEISSNG
ncbi:MAG: hypothetical protein JKX85_15950 [Phycisphaeraceae bacterium]|nr:hypothetical protein [Phycisphaeraceae bacterium]